MAASETPATDEIILSSSNNAQQQEPKIDNEDDKRRQDELNRNQLKTEDLKEVITEDTKSIIIDPANETKLPSPNYNPLIEHDYCSSDSKSSSQSNENLRTGPENGLKNSQAANSKLDNATYTCIRTKQNDFNDNLSDSSSSVSNDDLVIAEDTKYEKSKRNISSIVKKRQQRKSCSGDMISPSIGVQSLSTRRARRSVSVTDKSEWIVGEEQLDSVLSEHLEEAPTKRKRGECDSSDYTGSDEEASEEISASDDDPDRLWCFCRKPNDGGFMIGCDGCENWFHGGCVGIQKKEGDLMKEWFCSECREKLDSGVPVSEIPKKAPTKKKKKTNRSTRRRGRPRKSEIGSTSTRSSARVARKSSSSLDPRTGVDNGKLKRNLSRIDIPSHDKFEEVRKVKEMIRERKKEFFFKRRLAEQKNLAKRNELGLGRPSLTASLSGGLDSLASSTSSHNLPEMMGPNTESKLEQKSHKLKPNIVVQISTKKGSNFEDAVKGRIVAKIVKKEKHKRHKKDSNDLDDDSSQDKSKNREDEVTTRKRSDSTSSITRSPGKKSQKDSPQSFDKVAESKHVVCKIKECLELRSKNIKDLDATSDIIEQLSQDIESHLRDNFKDGSKYKAKFRSLVFNLKDIKNEGLVKKVLNGEIPPNKLVKMSADEMASHELAKWRERENKHSIELIKRDAVIQAHQMIVKKTHKGEEVISAADATDTDDKNSLTPTKLNGSSEQLKEEELTTPADGLNNPSSTEATPCKLEDVDGTISESLIGNDSIKEHIPMSIKKEEKSKTIDSGVPENHHQNTEPKRIRVSIDTKIDPEKLSQLRVPLIKTENDTYPVDLEEELSKSPNHMEVDEESDVGGDNIDQLEEQDNIADDDDAYDPELSVTEAVAKTKAPINSCWSGSITMPEVATFNAHAKPLSGTLDKLSNDVGEDLSICGRIAPDQVQDYIKKLKSTTKNEILLAQIFPSSVEDEKSFTMFFEYLYSRNRYAVIQVSPTVLKDFYIMPVHERSSLPEVLKYVGNDRAFERMKANSLLALIVRSKKNTCQKLMKATAK